MRPGYRYYLVTQAPNLKKHTEEKDGRKEKSLDVADFRTYTLRSWQAKQ